MEKELKDKFDEIGKAVEDFKTSHTKELEEIKAKGEATQETKETVEKINEKISELEEGIKSFQVAAQRQVGNEKNEERKGTDEYKNAFNSFVRKGHDIPRDIFEKEAKEMSVIIDEDGGFLVTPEMSSEIVSKVFESSPMRALSSVQSISSDSLEILEDLDEIESGWVGEKQARPNTATPKLKMIKIPVHEIYANPLATQKLLDDASINIESFLAGKVGEKFARDEATAFVNGDGIGKPKGFLSYASGTSFNEIERVTTAAQGVFDDEELIDLFYKMKSAYLPGASWLMQRETEKILRKFKDSTSGQYLWQPGLNGSTQSSFLGHTINHANDMAELVGVPGTDASKEPIAFGNFKAGYQIVDRIGIRTLRDPYTNKPFVSFYTTKRVGGGVKNFESIKVLKLKA